MVKESLCNMGDLGSIPELGTGLGSLSCPWRREQLPTPVFWPRDFHGLYLPWGRKESGMTEQLSLSLSHFFIRLQRSYTVLSSSLLLPILPLGLPKAGLRIGSISRTRHWIGFISSNINKKFQDTYSFLSICAKQMSRQIYLSSKYLL